MYLLIKAQSYINFVEILASVLEYCTVTNHNRDEMKLLRGGMIVIFTIVTRKLLNVHANEAFEIMFFKQEKAF